jgi:dTDP-4-dehydrorhamnose reductase
MRILMTGAGGMLGSGLVPAFVKAGHDVAATDICLSQPESWGDAGPSLTELDVRQRGAVASALDGFKADFLFHLAAETSLEKSELDPAHAYLTNTVATKHAALACRDAQIPMVYISTAGVFDGANEHPYHEWDAANPINTYGRTKLEGERYVEQWVPDHFIVRAGWMVGGGPGKDHKFVAMMLDQIAAGATKLHAVGDKLGTPTYVPDFAECLIGLVESSSYGRYHMACEGAATRYEVTKVILEILGLADRVELVEVDSDHFAEQFWAARPRSEIMCNMHLDLLGLNTMRPWEESLADYLERRFSHVVEGAVGMGAIAVGGAV